MTDEVTSATTVELATELTIAWLGNPNTRAFSDDVPTFLKAMYDAVCGLDSAVQTGAADEPSTDYTPATTARHSLSSRDHIISMIDGKPYRTLRRHLWTHGLTPEQYRERYKLKADYPMVAPSYSEVRSLMAKKIGLGQKRWPSRTLPATEEASAKPATRRGRKAKSPNAE